MFEKMRKCLDEFEEAIKNNVTTEEDVDKVEYFELNFAKAMLSECPNVDKVGRIIVVEKGLLDDVKIKFGK